MCGRYFIDDGTMARELAQIIEIVNRRETAEPVKLSGEIRPTDIAPVVASSRSLSPSAYGMGWGYTLSDGKKVINVRSETAELKPMFRDGMARRRCAVPASNYFEWERSGRQRTKYAIRPAGDGPMYMAGIYRMEAGRPVFAILTREPAEDIAFIHNRMPVLLPPELVRDWIDPQRGAGDILRHALLDVRYWKAGDKSEFS